MTKKSLKPLNQLFSPGTTRLGKQISFAFTTIGTTLTSVAVVMESSKVLIITSAVLTILGSLIGNLMKKDEEL
jgi:hypothetical protein